MWKEVHLKALHDETVRDASKGIFEVKEGDVGCLLLLPGVLHDLLHCQIMLNAAVDAWQKCLLHCGIDKVVADQIGSETLVEKEIKGLSNAG